MKKDFNNNEEILRRLFYDGYLTQAAYDDLLREDWLGSQNFIKESKLNSIEEQRKIGPSLKAPVYKRKITTTTSSQSPSGVIIPGPYELEEEQKGSLPNSTTWTTDQYGILHPAGKEFSMPIFGPGGGDYFLVTYIINEGLTGERTEQKIMTKEEANNLSFLGYRIVSISRIY